MFSPLQVIKIEKIFSDDQGCTRPVQVKLENGTEGILKYPKNHQGEIVLFNELISSCIAKAVNLTIPDFGLACISDTTSISSDISDPVSHFSGIGFYSVRIPKAVKASPSILKLVDNLGEAERLVLLDFIVKNTDRYPSNVLITSTAPLVMYSIDFSHAFGDPEWDTTMLVHRKRLL